MSRLAVYFISGLLATSTMIGLSTPSLAGPPPKKPAVCPTEKEKQAMLEWLKNEHCTAGTVMFNCTFGDGTNTEVQLMCDRHDKARGYQKDDSYKKFTLTSCKDVKNSCNKIENVLKPWVENNSTPVGIGSSKDPKIEKIKPFVKMP